MRVRPLGLLITVSWLTMMTLLIRDQWLPRPLGADAEPVDPAALTADWENRRDFFIIRRGRETLGAAAVTLEQRREGPGFRASHRLRLALPLGLSLSFDAAASLGPRMELERFCADIAAPGLRAGARGQVRAETMLIEVTGPAGRGTYSQPCPGGVSLLDAVRPRLLEEIRLEPGASLRIPSADLLGGLGVGDLVVEVREYELIETTLGRVPAYEVATDWRGARTSAWVDEDGRILVQQLWGEVVLERVPRPLPGEPFADLLNEVPLPGFELAADGARPWSAEGQSLLSLPRLAQEAMP